MKIIFVISIFMLSAYLLGCKKNPNGSVIVVPATPSNLIATPTSISQITLEWTDKSTNEEGFKVQRKTASTSYADIATLSRDVTNFSDNGLISNTTYTYRVYAYNSAGGSLLYSNEVQATTFGLPSVTTTTVTDITNSSATSGGNVSNNGGALVLARGVVWSTSPNPTILLSTKTIDGSGIGNYNSSINLLNANTTYYLRAYATNIYGTGYGSELSFTTSSIDLTTGLVAYFPFTGNAGDSSGFGNHGIVNNASLTTDRFGRTNSAFNFNGSSSYIKVNNSTSLNNSSLSISGWFNTNDLPTNDAANVKGIIGKWWQSPSTCNGNYNAYLVCLTKPTGQIPVLGGATTFYEGNTFYANTQININTWYHFTFIHNAITGGKLYINGYLINSNNLVGNICNSINAINIGADITNGTVWRFFNGKIDDIRIYSRVLNQAEITYLATH